MFMKERVVFLFYHGLSHVIAILKLARILERNGYEVYFAGAEFFRQYVSSQEFKFKGLKSVPFGLGFEKWVRTIEKEKYIYWSALRDRISDRLYTARDVELYWMLEEIRPSFVFIDSRQATDFIILYRHLKDRNIKIALTHTMLPATVGHGRPPLNSGVFPNDEDGVQKAIQRMKWTQFKARWQKKIIHWGFDDQYIINRRLKKNRIPAQYIDKTPGLLNFSLRNLDEFVIAPQEFDFPNPIIESRQHYIGFMTNEIFNDKPGQDYTNALPILSDLKQNKNRRLILCSFGTIEPNDSTVIFSFIRQLIQVSLRKNYILVIALKAKHEDIRKLLVAADVFIFNFVPQLQVLKDADLFITHGGFNSIREAIIAEVPMLVYPFHPEFDPIGNAARIVYHQLGLRGNAVTDSDDEIDAKISELLSNPVYKKNIQELKQRDSEQYTAGHFIQKLNAISPISI
jgi:zeaxanthin glucosyltransferase